MSVNTTKPPATNSAAAKLVARKAALRAGAKSSKRSRTIIIVVALLALLVLPGSVWAWIHFRHLSRLQKVQQLAALEHDRHNRDMSDEERQKVREQWHNAMDNLTEAERQEMWRQRMAEGMRRDKEEMDKYMAMTAAERAAYMKKQVDEMAKRMDERAQRDKDGKGGDSNGGGPRGSGGGGPGGGGGRGGRNGLPPTADQREQFRKQMLDNTTPEQRAEHTIYRQALASAIGQQNTVRMQQGLQPIPAPGTSGYRPHFGH